MLPSLDANTTVTAEDAKQDRIQIILGTWFIEGDVGPEENAAGELLYQLSHITLADLVEGNGQGSEINWFNAYQNDGGALRLNIRSTGHGGHTVENTPLISGHLRPRRVGSAAPSNSNRYQLRAHLSINPTRFVRHRGWGLMGNDRNGNWNRTTDPSLLLSRQVPSRYGGEVILHRNDNVLLTRREQSAGRSDVWPNQLDCYYRNIWNLLDRCINHAAAERQLSLSAVRDINLRKVETYWEYSTDDALHFVASVAPHFQALARNTSLSEYPSVEGAVHQEVEHNSLQVSMRVSRARELKLYSKTNKRIRLEVTHDLMGNAQILRGGHTSTDVGALFRWIGLVELDAADLANSVLGALRPYFSEVGEQLPAYVLVSRLYDACTNHHVQGFTNQQTFDWLLSQLITTGRISMERSRTDLDPVRLNLERRGVLVRTLPYSRVFCLHPQFTQARQLMMHTGILQGPTGNS